MDDFRITGFLRCNSWLFIRYKWVLYNYGLLSLNNLPIMTSNIPGLQDMCYGLVSHTF